MLPTQSSPPITRRPSVATRSRRTVAASAITHPPELTLLCCCAGRGRRVA